MTSTTANKKFIIGLIWLIIWQILAMLIKEEILLPSPLLVLEKFINLLGTKDFYISILSTSFKIILGFGLAILIALVFAYFSYKYQLFYEFIRPIILIFKSVPIASLTILLLFWIKSENLSVYVAFIMAMPIIYTNVYTGLISIDKKLIQMAEVYQITERKKLHYIYGIKVRPFLTSSIITVSGLVFKAGVAAEVIGLPANSIGKNLYNSKVYLDMPALMAWTLSILILSMGFEKLLRLVLGGNHD